VSFLSTDPTAHVFNASAALVELRAQRAV